MFPITPAERRWVLWFALALALLTTLPYIVAFAAQGRSWVFTGFVFGVEDGNSYIAKMLSGAAGAWLFRTPYTSLPQSGVLAFLPYLLLGKLTAPPGQHEQLVALYHLFRIAGVFLYCLATYDFIAAFIHEIPLRRWGLALAALGGGIGWLLAIFGLQNWLAGLPRGAIPGLDLPLAYYSPETFGFLELFGLPHLAVGRALLLWGLRSVLFDVDWAPLSRLVSRLPWAIPGSGVLAGLCFLGLGFMQPLTVVTGWAVLAAFLGILLLARRSWSAMWQSPYRPRAVWAVVISAPLVLYTLIAFQFDPVVRAWTAQNLILSPNWLYYVLAYSLLLPFALVGAPRLWRALGDSALLPIAWVLIFPLLAYAPYNLQRRLPEGVWVAWILLALASASDFRVDVPLLKKRFRFSRRALYLVSGLGYGAALILMVGALFSASTPQEPLFRTQSQVRAFESLRQFAAPGEVVLAAYSTGNALPAWAPQRVVIGHGPESVGLAELEPQVAAFYRSQTPDAERLAFLDQQRVAFVYWGEAERQLGNWDPHTAPYLEPLIDQDGEQILRYRVPEGGF
jgi:hypothetical protein